MSPNTSAKTDSTVDPTRRMSSEERREQIIEAAIAVFGAKGYVGTTTDDVARAASVSQPYVVRLFGTKENLFLEALGSALDELLDDPEQRSRLGEAARTWVVEERDWHKITSRVDGVYRGLLGQSSTEA